MKRLPIRLRLTAVFALAMAVVLILVSTFVYLRVASDLATAIDDNLRTRVDELAATIQRSGPSGINLGSPSAEGAEDFRSEVVTAEGSVVASSEVPGTPPVLDPSQLSTAKARYTFINADDVPGIDGNARLLVRPANWRGTDYVIVAGASTVDRSEALSGLFRSFAIGAPLALLLASGLGYLTARFAMRPVEDMTRRAEEISLSRSGERLPLPPTADEIGDLGRTLNEMLDRIGESVDRERAFVADASHELRTPLTVMRAELELGARADRTPEETRAAMRSAVEEVERLQALTDDLLTLAHSDDGLLPVTRRPVAIRELLESTRARFVVSAADKGRAITINSGNGLTAELDRLKIEGALSNLVDNAVRHGSGDIALRARLEGGAIRIDVADEGPGFPEGFDEVAFDRFSRAETGRTTPGDGLGLAIVKAIAEAHGGTVSIIEDDRATVSLLLPLRS